MQNVWKMVMYLLGILAKKTELIFVFLGVDMKKWLNFDIIIILITIVFYVCLYLLITHRGSKTEIPDKPTIVWTGQAWKPEISAISTTTLQSPEQIKTCYHFSNQTICP